jgi:hypothetical protein
VFSRYITQRQQQQHQGGGGRDELVVGQHQLAQVRHGNRVSVCCVSVQRARVALTAHTRALLSVYTQILGGLVAGAMTVVVTNPLDVVKTVP